MRKEYLQQKEKCNARARVREQEQSGFFFLRDLNLSRDIATMRWNWSHSLNYECDSFLNDLLHLKPDTNNSYEGNAMKQPGSFGRLRIWDREDLA